MSLYPWIAIAFATWLGVAALLGVLLGHLIAFGVGNDNRGAAPPAATTAPRKKGRFVQPLAERLRA